MPAAYDFRAIEARWQAAWDDAGCHRAPRLPDGPKFFNYDSGPFPNGPLHVGHVRTYLFGDVTARYQRLRGRAVLYATEWDAFGLPNELEAVRQGCSPANWTRRWIDTMTRQMRALGISYDWSRVRATCDPDYYGVTQRLFLLLLERGLVEPRSTPVSWCPDCATALSEAQVDRGRCWRCATTVERRDERQWFVAMSRYTPALLASLDGLAGWSERVRRLVRAQVASDAPEWCVSRQRAWGTPIPIVRCPACGDVPVPAGELPVRLPDDLDWSRGARALGEHPEFAVARCPRCRGPARRETSTLDCFFDDLWCFFGCLTADEDPPGLPDRTVQAWLPVDRFHSGFDTVAYLHLHRFLGVVLHDAGLLADPEPIGGHVGHALVLTEGRKMSKHLGNAVSPAAALRSHGADAVRMGVLRAAGPRKELHWDAGCVERAATWLASIHRFYVRNADVRTCGDATGEPSRAERALVRASRVAASRVGRFIEEYRFNAAVEELERLWHSIEAFATPRAEAGRLRPEDAPHFGRILEEFAVLLSPFAPHLAEELWAAAGRAPFAARSSWPVTGSERSRG